MFNLPVDYCHDSLFFFQNMETHLIIHNNSETVRMEQVNIWYFCLYKQNFTWEIY